MKTEIHTHGVKGPTAMSFSVSSPGEICVTVYIGDVCQGEEEGVTAAESFMQLKPDLQTLALELLCSCFEI